MKIVKPQFSLRAIGNKTLSPEEGVELLRWVEFNARISHRTETAQDDQTWQRFIEAVVLDHGDWSVTEHGVVTAIIRVNRGLTHEVVRHRLFSFTQESTRFVNYGKEKHEPEFIISSMVDKDDKAEWEADVAAADAIYRKWLKRGYAPQIARDHLPNALAATIAVTGNLRNWRHFFLMRTSVETHPDLKVVSIPMLTEFQRCIPLLYRDIIPNMRQIDNLRKAR